MRENIFGGLVQEVITCQCGHIEELLVQNMPGIIPIPVKGDNIQTCLANYFATEDIKWRCPNCQCSTVSKCINIINEPETLLLQVMRFKYSQVKEAVMKKHEPLICPTHLHLHSNSMYTLKSVVNHKGNHPQTGHYTSVIYDKDNDMFIVIDDDLISTDNQLDQYTSKLSYVLAYVKDV